MIDADFKKFGRGPRELTGAVDLISRYRLLPHHDFFCKRSLHVSISDTHYLYNVVGDTEIRKGEGMELGQLIGDKFLPRKSKTRIQPFDLNILSETFQLQEAATVSLADSEKGIPTIAGKSKSESKEKKHKKHKDKDKEKDKEHKKHKHRHKDKSKDKDKEKKKDKSRHHDKKRKHNGDEDANDIHKQKKSKVKVPFDPSVDDHRSSNMEAIGAMGVAGGK